MNYAGKYRVNITDSFIATDYPLVTHEIKMVKIKTDCFAPLCKVEMIISFVKRHALLQTCIRSNPALAQLIVSGQLFNGELESLFDAACANSVFCSQLEGFIEDELMRLPVHIHY